MATPAVTFNKAGKELTDLLLTAAGIPPESRYLIRSITCRCSFQEAVSFTIEKYGDEESIAKAVTPTYEQKTVQIEGTGLETEIYVRTA
jgi:hypothetical protein